MVDKPHASRPSEALVDATGRKAGAASPDFRRKVAEIALTDKVGSDITVGETYFFRDWEQFELLRNTVIPDRLSALPLERPITAWCAGCSTGEEAYSLAILMEEEGLAERTRIVATDVSGEALESAVKAEYGEWSFRNGSDLTVSRYFVRQDGSFRLDSRLARRVSFARHRLGDDGGPPPEAGEGFDFVLCRNVLMYLEEDEVKAAAVQLFECLAEGGWLLTGPFDPPLWDYGPFETELVSSGIAYRRPKALKETRGPPRKTPPSEPKNEARADRYPEAAARIAPPERSDTASLLREHGTRSTAGRIDALLRSGDLDAAQVAAAEAVDRHPLSAELQYLHGVSLAQAGRREEAVAALRRSIYLDQTFEAAHFRMGVCLADDDPEGAIKEFGNALEACSFRRSGESVPFTNGLTAAEFLELAAGEITRLETQMGRRR